MKLISS
jgi:hypothetical protein